MNSSIPVTIAAPLALEPIKLLTAESVAAPSRYLQPFFKYGPARGGCSRIE
jgi:hypothetical protein